MIPLLSKIEALVFRRLCLGGDPPQIVDVMNEKRAELYPKKFVYVNNFYNLTHFHAICQTLRRKTGISNLKDMKACQRWADANRYTPQQQERGPTPQQLRILYLLAIGEKYPAIQRSMKLSLQACMNLASEARKRAGITDNLPSSALAYFMKRDHEQTVRDRLAAQGKLDEPPKDPMDDPCF